METTTLVPGETETLTGSGTVTTDGDIQVTVSGEPVVPAVEEAAPVVETTVPNADSAPVEPVVESAPVVDAAAVEAAVVSAPVSIFYMGQEVKRRFGLFDADGAEECELADGTTAFVPKSVLGE